LWFFIFLKRKARTLLLGITKIEKADEKKELKN